MYICSIYCTVLKEKTGQERKKRNFEVEERTVKRQERNGCSRKEGMA
jgi:hypothetical protein